MSSSSARTLPDAQSPTLRVAFVGQHVYFRHCSLERPAGGLDPTFLDFRAGAPPQPLIAGLRELDPDVVLVFRPEIVPPGLFAGLRAVTLGYLTEPLPRAGGRDHPDLRERLRWLKQVDPSNFDRIVSFDPLIADTAAGVLPVSSSLPIPVADSLYAAPRPRSRPPALLFIGRPTDHRERLLAPVKRRHPIAHFGHGMFGEQLQSFLARADVQLNLHNNPYPSFENRVCIALAAGHLVISEPLSPSHGLAAGEHYLQIEGPEELLAVVEELADDPQAHADVQAAGHAQSERFRASRVYPELIRATLASVATDGSSRAA